MRNVAYAAGSIVEAIESGQVLKNVGGGHVHMQTVECVNVYGFHITTEHGYETSADWLRNHYKERGYKDIK